MLLTRKREAVDLNSAMLEDFSGSTLGVSVIFSSSPGMVLSNSKGALSEFDHSLGEVGDVGELGGPELLNFIDMPPSRR
jgi:hypothetical protein